MNILRPLVAADAEALYPLIYKTKVTDTLLWDGPESLETFRQDIAERADLTARGERYIFTILDQDEDPIGAASLRPDEENFRADIGLWIGAPHHGKGYGTTVISELVAYGFKEGKLAKIEATVFTGNWSSRKIFEGNGFLHEGTIRKAVRKRGLPQDEWFFGLTSEEYALLLHICARDSWEKAKLRGSYQPVSLAQEGFIHCSRIDQVVNTANRFYAEEPDLLLLWIDPNKLAVEVRWERVNEGAFPHLYGPLNLSAVAGVCDFSPEASGRFRRVPRPAEQTDKPTYEG